MTTNASIDDSRSRGWYHGLLEPDRRYFHVDLDCVGYTVVARDEAHVKELMPDIYFVQCTGGMGEPDKSYAEAVADYDLFIREIPGESTIWDDGRDGLQHRIDTYPLGTWASSEY